MRDSVPSARYSLFVMYCVYGESGTSLLIESTDSMILTIEPQPAGATFARCVLTARARRTA